LDDEDRLEQTEPRSAVVLGDRNPEPAMLTERLPELGREALLAVALPPVLQPERGRDVPDALDE
jgi:hypothetical protein